MTAIDAAPVVSRSGLLRRWWRSQVVGTVDHVAVLARVEEEAVWSARYLFMTLMSAGIALLGLLLSSPAVVIGAMLISPLMGPIIGLGFALAIFDFRELRRSATALAIGSLIAILFTAAIVALSPIQTVTGEIAARTRPNLFDLLVALFSALAGAYAMIRGRSGTIVGVAIATALMPPLAVVGFGLATWNIPVFSGALLLFVTNLITIALTATIMARIYGFGAHLSPHQTRLQAILLVVAMVALAIPLALALRQIAWESLASRVIQQSVLDPFVAGSRVSQIDIDYDARPIRVRAVVLTPLLVPAADGRVDTALETRFARPIDLRIDQLRIAPDSQGVAAAQVAAAQGSRPPDPTGAIRARVAAVAGVDPAAVVIDPETRQVRVRPASLPDATLPLYRALELRAGLPDWRVAFVPPMLDLPAPRLVDGAPDPQSLAPIAWAAARLGRPVSIAGRGAASVAEALREAGVDARIGRTSGALSARWAEP